MARDAQITRAFPQTKLLFSLLIFQSSAWNRCLRSAEPNFAFDTIYGSIGCYSSWCEWEPSISMTYVVAVRLRKQIIHQSGEQHNSINVHFPRAIRSQRYWLTSMIWYVDLRKIVSRFGLNRRVCVCVHSLRRFRCDTWTPCAESPKCSVSIKRNMIRTELRTMFTRFQNELAAVITVFASRDKICS